MLHKYVIKQIYTFGSSNYHLPIFIVFIILCVFLRKIVLSIVKELLHLNQ